MGLFPEPPSEIVFSEKGKKARTSSKTNTPGVGDRQGGTNGFQIIPSISVNKGKAVVALEDGFKPFDIALEDVFESVISKYERLLLVDYDGLLRNRPQLDLIQDIKILASDLDRELELWVEAGIRFADNAIDIFVAGADTVVICTSLIASKKELSKAAELSGDLALTLDCTGEGNIVSPSRIIRENEPCDLAREVSELGIKRLILDTVVTDRSQTTGLNTEKLAAQVTRLRKCAPESRIFVHCDSSTLEILKEQMIRCGASGIILDLGPDDIRKMQSVN